MYQGLLDSSLLQRVTFSNGCPFALAACLRLGFSRLADRGLPFSFVSLMSPPCAHEPFLDFLDLHHDMHLWALPHIASVLFPTLAGGSATLCCDMVRGRLRLWLRVSGLVRCLLEPPRYWGRRDFSISFARVSVPLTTYAVEWTQADGQPIMFRTDKMVQDELAFDPFAMMDEQPDSEFTTVTLKPSPILTSSHRSVRALDGPRARQVLHMDPRQISHVTRTEYVGCCGFPIRTGGIVGRIATSDIYDSVDSLGIEQNVGDDGIVGAASGQSQASKHSEFEIENVKRTEYIGCCGFPIRTGGFQAHIGFSDISDSVDTPGGEQDVGDDEIVKTVSGQSLASKHSEFIRLCQVMPKARALHANRDRARAHTGPARIGGEALLERQPHDRPSCDRYVESEALTTATHATVALPCAEVSRASINGAGNQGDDNYVSL